MSQDLSDQQTLTNVGGHRRRTPTRTPVLLVLSGPDAGHAFPLSDSLVLGRDPTADVRIDDPRVSRQHAILKPVGPDYLLRDNQSANGTFVNGQPIRLATLCDGDLIQLGSDAVFKYTSQTEAERQLQQRHKLESLGALAGGVAHDFNNLLAVIGANAAVLGELLEHLGAGTEAHSMIADIQYATRTAGALTRQLLDFARQDAGVPEHREVAPVLDRIAQLARRSFPAEVQVVVEAHAGLVVEVDSQRLEQAVLNLLINARDALPQGGEVRLAARPAQRPQESESRSSRWVEIRVEDPGIGMDPETLRRATEPFFTTKPRGRGTGLGLAMAHATAMAHGGVMSIDSAPGSGTTVCLLLPCCSSTEQTRRQLPPQRLRKEGMQVLLVDDDEWVRRATARLLRRFQVEVVVASGGAEAVEMIRREPSRFELVVLDMLMPGMSGRETFLAIRELSPDLRVLVCSGFSENRAGDLMSERGCAFVRKPFAMDELEQAIDELLLTTA